MNDGSKQRITVFSLNKHRSFQTESAVSSDTHLAEVIAKRNATLKDRNLSSTDSSGSKGKEVSACRTKGRSQVRWWSQILCPMEDIADKRMVC